MTTITLPVPTTIDEVAERAPLTLAVLDTLAIANVGDQWKPSEDGTSVAIEVEDFDAAIEGLKQAKARFAAEGIESPVCWMAVVQDPDGNKIIIHKLKNA